MPQSQDMGEILQACARGDTLARRQFQDMYGEDIYNFPVKIYGVSSEEAGDFYLYVFENDRIFTRLLTFSGRNNIQFRTFLSYYVLKTLFLEWLRTTKELDTVSLYTPLGNAEGSRTLEDTLPAAATSPVEEVESPNSGPAAEIWNSLSPEERLDLKLLFLLERDPAPAEIREIARTSGRSLRETLSLLSEIQEGLRRKDEKLSRLTEDLDSVWGWILLRQKELQEINEKLRLLKKGEPSAGQNQLLSRQQEVERALAKRYRQREKIKKDIYSYKMTTPYKDIAQLLNLTVGTVSSRIFRLRERILQELGKRNLFGEHTL